MGESGRVEVELSTFFGLPARKGRQAFAIAKGKRDDGYVERCGTVHTR